MTELLQYEKIRLLDIRSEQIEDWQEEGASHIRVTLPASAATEIAMQKRGFFWADRTLGVSISLRRSKLDFESLVRLEIEETDRCREDILRIARASFPDDRRFHVGLTPDPRIADVILSKWVEELDDCLICRHKGAVIGFLTLEKQSEQIQFIRLAAVEEKYRMSGAAMSLYAKAALLCGERGIDKLNGRISARNVAVMNLYAFLGGVFSAPEDVFLKETGK